MQSHYRELLDRVKRQQEAIDALTLRIAEQEREQKDEPAIEWVPKLDSLGLVIPDGGSFRV